MMALLAAAGLLLAFDPSHRPQGEPRVSIDFNDAPAAVLWAEIAAEREASAFPPSPWPAWESDAAADGWDTREPWDAWVETVRAEATATAASPLRRAQLCRLALLQQRYAGAWTHFARCRGDAGALVALMPALFPGAPLDHPVLAGGVPAPLPDGVLLTPALPPPRAGDGAPMDSLGELSLARFQVGEAQISLRLALQPDGIQIDIAHVDGPAARVSVRLPAAPRRAIEGVYVDWTRADEVALVHTFTLSAEEPEHSVWGRFRTSAPRWPGRSPRALPAAARAGGIVLEPTNASAAFRARVGRVARATHELLGVACVVVEPGAAPVQPWAAPHVRIEPESGQLAELIARIEAFALMPNSR